jgi:DnaJ-class molecular chaperone
MKTCETCKGSGKLEVIPPPGEPEAAPLSCPTCFGTGEVDDA